MIGANAEAIATAEDRENFKVAMTEIGLESCRSRIAHSMDEARAAMDEIGLPTMIRPAYILGGRGTGIAHTVEEFETLRRPASKPARSMRFLSRNQSLAGRNTSSRSCAITPTTA